jgi:TolA-binding protein
MPESVPEPPETGPATIALPDREAPEEAPTTPPAVPVMPEMPPTEEAPPRPTDIQSEAMEAQVTPTVEPRLAGLGEVGLVEAVATARKQYERTLEALKAYYTARGHNAKIEWAESELRGYAATPKPRYLLAAELAGPELRPSRPIEAADQLYEEGLHFKNYPAFPPGKKDYLKVALEKFRTVIEKYPQSDKIDDAAFRMGEIYGGWYFQDYARAVMSYERCWQWNPGTEHPARFNAAKIFEEKLKNRAKAVELYNEVIAHTQDEELAKQAQERIRTLTGR